MADRTTPTPERAATTAAALRVLSELAPDRRTPHVDVSGAGPTTMAWLGTLESHNDVGDPTTGVGPPGVPSVPVPVEVSRSAALEALARHDALSPGTDDLRIGWLWIVGRATVAGTERRMVLPLLSRPARVERSVLRTAVVPLGPWDLWPLVEDEVAARDLERGAAFGGGALDPRTNQQLVDRLRLLRSWADRVVAASGLPPVARMLASTDPTQLTSHPGLVAVVGFGAVVELGVEVAHPHQTLGAWSRDPAAAGTAFASLYVGAPNDTAIAPTAAVEGPLQPTLPLNPRQAEVVHRSRWAPVTVVSGPPGTGKSQTAAAVALDAVGRGESVLVATRSSAAAEVLAGLLERLPGPDPVLFGGGEQAQRLAARLADGLGGPPATTTSDRVDRADDAHAEMLGVVHAGLGDLAAAEEWSRRSLTLTRHAVVAPRLLDVDGRVETFEAAALVHRARRPGGWFGALRRRRAADRLTQLVGAPPDTPLEDVAAAVDLAAVRDRAGRALGRDLERSARCWAALVEADHERRLERARQLAASVATRAGGDARRAVAALATALRAGRATRRSYLSRVDMAELTRALPLWIGTLGEIEGLLPPTAAAFDLVVLDEASQIDQFSASAALLRARRAVVIGDPRQLRFVSFVADRAVAGAVEAHGTGAVADRLDVRRVSAFDLAAGAAPVSMLEEHYRSAPHLIGFSAQRFYDGRLLLATRHPENDDEVAIEVRRVGGARTDGVNRAEVTPPCRRCRRCWPGIRSPPSVSSAPTGHRSTPSPPSSASTSPSTSCRPVACGSGRCTASRAPSATWWWRPSPSAAPVTEAARSSRTRTSSTCW